ncbi:MULTISPECIES: hypothetical protein [unclassified Curtobacterium]|uniref:hypothetical protein n=1 Tax=unclassified Curtobacterium TaxID=257496 RepID=UPI000DA8EB47|nr:MULTISPECIES: hypothetical protein [unclassified Curtobacterium]WIB65943.1 hypothetical protein DEI94_17675 [Curtobacterium sp. MCBD17_040]WIB69174.1 hypothetical protein DEI93_16225 [Curtobacterium sp. MCBD17_035]
MNASRRPWWRRLGRDAAVGAIAAVLGAVIGLGGSIIGANLTDNTAHQEALRSERLDAYTQFVAAIDAETPSMDQVIVDVYWRLKLNQDDAASMAAHGTHLATWLADLGSLDRAEVKVRMIGSPAEAKLARKVVLFAYGSYTGYTKWETYTQLENYKTKQDHAESLLETQFVTAAIKEEQQ